MSNPRNIITISQEEGSGGREIALFIARKLKLSLVDEHFIQEAYHKLGITDEEFANFDEKVLPKLSQFASTLNTNPDYYLSEVLAPDRPGFGSTHQGPFVCEPSRTGPSKETVQNLSRAAYQTVVENLIKEIAVRGKVVFLDLGANLVLKKWPQVLNLRIIAPFEDRLERAIFTNKIPQELAASLLRERDYHQEAYIRKFYGPDCANPALYHLVINTANISLPAITEALYKLVREFETSYQKKDPLEVHRSYSRLVEQESYTLEEASLLLWIDHDILRKAVYQGELKGNVIDHNVIRIGHEALMDWLKSRDTYSSLN